ncbi:MAG: hypothetical protein Kow00127_17330 [Bacteroidales bacterium]
MGIIEKQAIRGAIWSYTGVVIGAVTTILVYPKIFTSDQIGLLRILVAWATLLGQFATLGFNRTTTMLFPWFRDPESRHHGFFALVLKIALAGFILVVLFTLLFKPLILGDNPEPLFRQWFWMIVPLTAATLLFFMFDTYYKVLYNAVQGTFLKEFLQRVLILAAAFLFMAGAISFDQYVWFYLAAFSIPVVVLVSAIIRQKAASLKFDGSFIDHAFRKKMIQVSFYGILTSFSGVLVLNIDSIMINQLLDLSNTGIYAITFFIGSVILIPSRSLLKISSVVIADAWKKERQDEINTVYYKSCQAQLLIALYLFTGIWVNVHNLFNPWLLPPEFEAGKYVIFFIGLSAVIQMAGGTSNMILFTSPRYRMHTWMMLGLVILLVLTNYLFIPVWGITGAAAASALSFLIYNLMKYLYLRKQFGFRPYDIKTVIMILTAVVIGWIATLIPRLDFFLTDIVVRGLVVTVLFYLATRYFRLSEDILKKLRFGTGKSQKK